MNITQNHPAYDRLPKRLTIAFPIWGLYDIDGKGFYADTDKIVREHVERGFNCMRLDSGAGLMHDINGKPRGKVKIGNAFSQYDKFPRQLDAIGGEGYCDVLQRIINLATSCKKHGVYLILSSWYYLHTYWICHDETINSELFNIPEEERFMAFAKFLHYIISELKARNLADVIAYAEIFNEVDGLYFVTDEVPESFTDEKIAVFRKWHEEAIDYLRQMHPDILFAYDESKNIADLRLAPENADVFSFHSYYLWSIYSKVAESSPDCFNSSTTTNDIMKAHTNYHAEIAKSSILWFEMLSRFVGLKPEKIPTFEARLEQTLIKDYEYYRDNAFAFIETVRKLRKANPNIRIVSGEGGSYIASKKLLWEEHSEIAWDLMEEVVRKYRDEGLWGTVIRTCMGPEDPAWHLMPEKILKINRMFLGE